jgi:hypothetical protein
MEQYSGLVSVDGQDDTVYLELSINDLDSSGWVGAGAIGSVVPGITVVGEYEVTLIDSGHHRRGQTATASVEVEVVDAELHLCGLTPFD